MDPAIVGELVTIVGGLLAAIITRTRCYMRASPAEDTRMYQWQAGCGFTEAQLVPNDSRIETRELKDNEIIFARKSQ